MGGVPKRKIVAAAVAATLAVPLLALAVVQATTVFDGDDSEAAQRTTTAMGLREVTRNLRMERLWATGEALGMAALIAPGAGGDAEDAVRRTDAAVSELRADLDDGPEDVAAPYRGAVDALDELQAIRAAVDAVGTGAPPDIEAVEQVVAPYDELMHALDDAARQAASSIDDPNERRGAALLATVSQQASLGDELTGSMVLVTLGSGGADTPEEIATISELLGTWTSGLEEIRQAEGPFASVVAEHFRDEQAAELSALADDLVSRGSVDPNRLIAVDTGMIELEAAVAARQAEIVAQAGDHDEDEDEERLAMLIAAGAMTGGLALLVFAVVVVVVGRRSPPRGPWGPHGTGAPAARGARRPLTGRPQGR